jgi:ribosomal protein S18 acetylase RimI-like enzyme
MSLLICPFTRINISELNSTNINKWIISIKTNYTINPNNLRFFDVDSIKTKTDYIDFIKTNIKNKLLIKEIFNNYKTNRELYFKRMEEEILLKKTELYNNSIKYVNIDETAYMIRLLKDEDLDSASKLYYEYKNSIDEEYKTKKEIETIVEDYILKDNIYGIFIKESKYKLIGICIKATKNFKIDDSKSNKVDTFYIQEIFINSAYQGRKLGECLFKYILDFTVPEDTKYISFMTQLSNGAMHKIAEKYKFIRQDIVSGDPKNPVLYIKKIKE